MIGTIRNFGKEVMEKVQQELDEKNRSGKGRPIRRTRKKTISKYKGNRGEEKND